MNRTRVFAILAATALAGVLAVRPARADCPPDAGAALAAACPCDGPALDVPWRNHGQYVSCIVRFRNDLRRDGCLTAETQRTIARCAARSTCGKAGAVLCCFADLGTCEGDSAPGDGTAAGTCSNESALGCDVDVDCTVLVGPKVKRRVELCTAHGGYSAGTGSVCSACPPPPAP